MNKTKQFWALFKFQFAANPVAFVAPVILLLPLTTKWIMKGIHLSLDSLLMNSSIFIYAMVIFMILMPEIFQRANPAYTTGIELLLTRAVDRPIVYRSKSFLLFLIVLLLPLAMVFRASLHPDLQITEYSKATQSYYLQSLPGSTLSVASKHDDPVISIPRGNILLSEWQFWTPLALLTAIQLLVALLYPFKYRVPLLWAVYIGFIFLPLFNILPMLRETKHGVPLPNVQFFLFFVSHQLLFWVVTALLFVLAQLWCERRFCRFEF